MERPRNLNEYRNERIETMKSVILDVAQDNLLDRTDGDFAAVFGKTTPYLFELFIMPDGFDSGFAPAPNYVLKETAINLATALNAQDDLPYTVDMGEIEGEHPHIRIVRM